MSFSQLASITPVSSNQLGKILCTEGSHIYYINHEATKVHKVDTSTFVAVLIPMGDTNLYQISVSNNRIYGLSENGTVQICYRNTDKLFSPVKKNHMKDSDEESLDMSDDEGNLSKYITKVVKIKPFDLVEDDGDATNASIFIGSDNEDNHHGDMDEPHPKHESPSRRY